MKTYNEKEVVVTEKTVTAIYCDKCNNRILKSMFDAYTFKLEIRTGSSYPEGGSGVTYGIDDLCEPCAMKMLELLKQNGYRTYGTEWDW